MARAFGRNLASVFRAKSPQKTRDPGQPGTIIVRQSVTSTTAGRFFVRRAVRMRSPGRAKAMLGNHTRACCRGAPAVHPPIPSPFRAHDPSVPRLFCFPAVGRWPLALTLAAVLPWLPGAIASPAGERGGGAEPAGRRASSTSTAVQGGCRRLRKPAQGLSQFRVRAGRPVPPRLHRFPSQPVRSSRRPAAQAADAAQRRAGITRTGRACCCLRCSRRRPMRSRRTIRAGRRLSRRRSRNTMLSSESFPRARAWRRRSTAGRSQPTRSAATMPPRAT